MTLYLLGSRSTRTIPPPQGQSSYGSSLFCTDSYRLFDFNLQGLRSSAVFFTTPHFHFGSFDWISSFPETKSIFYKFLYFDHLRRFYLLMVAYSGKACHEDQKSLYHGLPIPLLLAIANLKGSTPYNLPKIQGRLPS